MAKREMPEDIGPNGKSYPSNSESDKKEKLEAVVDYEIKPIKKPLGKKFRDTFFNGDIEDIRSFLFFDVLIPAVKDTISELVRQGVDMLLYNESRHGPSGKKKSGTNTNYGSFYSGSSSNNNRRESKSYFQRKSDDLVELPFKTMGEAQRCLYDMNDLIRDYDDKSVSVADYYDLAGYTSMNFMDNKYGWYDLTGVRPYRVKLPREQWEDPRKPEYGWVLDLPRPEYIGD